MNKVLDINGKPFNKVEAVVFDLDNCISDDNWRQGLIDRSKEDIFLKYCNYHMLAGFDEFVPDSVKDFFDGSKKIFILTGRPLFYSVITLEWLNRNNIKLTGLFMRPHHDARPANVIKKEWAKILLDTGYNITAAFDDDLLVVDAYKDLGINAAQLAIKER